jgi:hypothetical protein
LSRLRHCPLTFYLNAERKQDRDRAQPLGESREKPRECMLTITMRDAVRSSLHGQRFPGLTKPLAAQTSSLAQAGANGRFQHA